MEMLKDTPKVVNHLHIPLQSGSDDVLIKMNRKYKKDYFKRIIDNIRSIRPDISITTDVIVGHPYESEKNFLECLSFCAEIKFSKIHVFPYSKRDGTAAAKMPNQVSDSIKKERALKLIELSNILEKEYYNKFLNKEVTILTEEINFEDTIGHTDNYLKVIIKEKLETNKFYKVKIIEINDNVAIGKI